VKIGSKGERGNGADGLAGGNREHHADIDFLLQIETAGQTAQIE